MFKKLSASILTLALVACVIAPAQAQDTIGLYADSGSGLSRFINTTPGVPFELAVLTKTADPSAAAEFVMSEILVLFPSVFKLSTVKVNNTPLDLGDNSLGVYIMAYSGCVGGGTTEVVRVQYGDFGGVIGTDVILKMRALNPDGSDGFSSFDGTMGFVDCSDIAHILTPEPWPAGTNIDPTKDVDTDTADGVAVLNADLVPNEVTSMGTLKSRF